jgi:co-chaperonin GroES (HSP10)
MPFAAMQHESDPAQEIWAKLGDLKDFHVPFGKVLVATYIRPEKTKSGIFLTDKARDEDLWQGKASLIVKMGKMAFQDTDRIEFHGERFEVGDWVAIRPSDAVAISLRGVPCRIVQDVHILMSIPSPDQIF